MLTSMLTAPVARGFPSWPRTAVAFGFLVVFGVSVVVVASAVGDVTAEATVVGVAAGWSAATGAGGCVVGVDVVGGAVVGAAVDGGTMTGGSSTVSATAGTPSPATMARPTRATAPHRTRDLVLLAANEDLAASDDLRCRERGRTTSGCVVPSGTAVREVRSSKKMRTDQIVCARSAHHQAWSDEILLKRGVCSR